MKDNNAGLIQLIVGMIITQLSIELQFNAILLPLAIYSFTYTIYRGWYRNKPISLPTFLMNIGGGLISAIIHSISYL